MSHSSQTESRVHVFASLQKLCKYLDSSEDQSRGVQEVWPILSQILSLPFILFPPFNNYSLFAETFFICDTGRLNFYFFFTIYGFISAGEKSGNNSNNKNSIMCNLEKTLRNCRKRKRTRSFKGLLEFLNSK